jgi:16S rRNA (guanine527-N7)-methyltransferase
MAANGDPGALASGVDVSDDQARIMGRHAVELLQWNRTTNLTAITDPLDVAVKHYVDALAVAPWLDRGARILDAGSGGGFPVFRFASCGRTCL